MCSVAAAAVGARPNMAADHPRAPAPTNMPVAGGACAGGLVRAVAVRRAAAARRVRHAGRVPRRPGPGAGKATSHAWEGLAGQLGCCLVCRSVRAGVCTVLAGVCTVRARAKLTSCMVHPLSRRSRPLTAPSAGWQFRCLWHACRCVQQVASFWSGSAVASLSYRLLCGMPLLLPPASACKGCRTACAQHAHAQLHASLCASRRRSLLCPDARLLFFIPAFAGQGGEGAAGGHHARGLRRQRAPARAQGGCAFRPALGGGGSS